MLFILSLTANLNFVLAKLHPFKPFSGVIHTECTAFLYNA